MRRHSKASAAGRDQCQSGGLDRILRRGLATRGVLAGSKGSGALATGRQLTLGALSLCALLLALSPAAASAAPGSCPNQGALGTDFLASCRAWELVTPPGKNGGEPFVMTSRTRAASIGDAVEFGSLVGFGDVHSLTLGTDYIAERAATPGTNGWTSHGISPVQDSNNFLDEFNGADPNYEGEMSPDLSRGIYRGIHLLPGTPLPANVAGIQNFYVRKDLRTPGPGNYQLLTDSEVPVPSSLFSHLRSPALAGASADFNHVIFHYPFKLTNNAPDNGETTLYESENGTLRFVGLVPPGTAVSCGGSGPTCEAAESATAGRSQGGFRRIPHMISADGSRVFFRAGNQNIYARINASETIELNASESTVPDSPQGAELWDASADGSRVFFTTGQELVNEDTDVYIDLYMYDFDEPAGHHLTLVSKDGEPADGEEVTSVVGASDDGDSLYFVARDQLVSGEEAPLKSPLGFNVAGLYLWHEGQITYIGRLDGPYSGGDAEENQMTNGYAFVGHMRGRVSPDGRHLLFSTGSDLGFKGRGGFAGYDSESLPEEYLYDAETGQLRCATCNFGAIPTVRPEMDVRPEINTSNARSTSHLSHSLSDDGRFVFFSTEEAISPDDTNSVADAYAYDAETEEIHLLSSGTSPDPSYFMDASADGRDAFFVTREQLSGWDVDTSYDLYDARLDGGLPEPALVPAPCEGDACRGAASARQGEASAGSASLIAPGNPRRSRGCPKGQHRVKSRGKARCVKQSKRKDHRRDAGNNRRAGR